MTSPDVPFEEHPLFPPRSEDEDPPEISWIQITRRDTAGRMVFCPQRFPAAELTDLAQIASLFGGGTYELIGRTGHGRLAAKRGYELAGASKPMAELEPPAGPSAQTGQPAVPIYAPQPAAVPTWVPMLTAFAPIILQWMSGQQAAQVQARQDSQAMLMAMMNQSQQSNAQIVTLLTSLNRPTGNTPEDFRKGMDFMQEIIGGQLERAEAQRQEQGEDAGIMKTIEQLTQAMGLVKDLTNMTDPNPPSPPVTVPGNGAA